MAHAKEIAQGNLDGVPLFIVPARQQHQPPQIVRLIAGMCTPDMVDAACAGNVGNLNLFARLDDEKVQVAAAPVPNIDAHCSHLTDARHLSQGPIFEHKHQIATNPLQFEFMSQISLQGSSDDDGRRQRNAIC